MEQKTSAGFTLLELIIAIIIVGVLVGLGLPRYFRLVEAVKAAEALNAMAAIRQAMERCYLMNGKSFANCQVWTASNKNTLDIEDPGLTAGTHFVYVTASATDQYYIIAKRNSSDGGEPYLNHYIAMGYGFTMTPNTELTPWQGIGDPGKIYWCSATIYQRMIPKN